MSPPHGPLVRPQDVTLLDYEIELGLVIGRDLTGHRVFSPSRLYPTVRGLVIGNDISARDVQIPQGQWYLGVQRLVVR